MKKIIILCLSLLTCLILSSCGCEHQWTDATCETPITCSICGKTRGKALGHKWSEPTCVDPEHCSVCGTEKPNGAKALGHDYHEGYCTICGEEDPDFINIENFGFLNHYGMDEWVEIKKYTSDFVELEEVGYGCGYIKIFSNYFYKCNAIDYCEKGTKDWKTYPCKILSNDVVLGGTSSSSESGLTIIERAKINSNTVILKTKQKYNGFDEWYVPADMLDWSTLKDISVSNSKKYRIRGESLILCKP